MKHDDRKGSRCVIVTGGSRGIGAEAARRFAERGDRVAIVYRSDDVAAAGIVDEILSAGGEARAYRADMGVARDVAAVIDAIGRDFGAIDVLVNNAARFETGAFAAIDQAMFDSLFHANLLGPITAIQACLPWLKPGGRVVNVISVLGLAPAETNILYSATKAALRAVTQGLAGQLGRDGVTINCVAPGVIMTDMMQGVPEDALRRVADSTPLGRLAQAEDIAPLIVFLASDDARWITGRTLVADGGRISF